jgi:hypothetical protein
MKEALEVVRKHNMCTYYLLPLLGINTFSFGVNINFKNCYANPQGTELYVSVYYLLSSLENHKHLLRVEGEPGSPIYVFDLPQKWQDHFKLFKQGKYSQFSREAKDIIIQNSGLRYKALNTNGFPTTDLRLMAIDDDKSRRNILRKKLSDYLDIEIAEDAELLSPPPESSFATYNKALTV